MSLPAEPPLASMPGQSWNTSNAETNELLRQLVAQTDPKNAPKRDLTVVLDRQKVGEIMSGYDRDEGFASFDPATSLAAE